MRSSNKSRSRNKNNRGRSNLGNIVNRVFDSSGPEGKVRGTPQQIIDKYQMLARDAQLAGDRVAAENFLQHSEHYSRLLGQAQREMNERRESQEAQRQQSQNNQNQRGSGGGQPQSPLDSTTQDQPEIVMADTADLFPAQKEEAGLVETPESSAPKKPGGRGKSRPKPTAAKPDATDETESETATVTAAAAPDLPEAKEA